MSLPPLQFLHVIRHLKTTPRTGWVNHSVPNPGARVYLPVLTRREYIGPHVSYGSHNHDHAYAGKC